MHNHTRIIVASALSLSGLFFSCTMKQDVYINKSGGGSISFEIDLADYLTDIINQITMLFEPEEQIPREDASFFDLAEIRKDFHKQDGLDLVRLESPTNERLVGELAFKDINSLVSDVEKNISGHHLIRLRKEGDLSELTVRIDRETVKSLLERNPSFNNPLVENFGPMATEGLSDEDYLSMMEFALGSESRRGINESVLELTVKVEGRIIDQRGGVLIDDSTVRYAIPMLPVLMLRKPMEYSLRYE